MSPAGSVLCKLTHDQKSKILLVAPGLEPGIDLLFLPSFPGPERIEENISCAPDPLLSNLKDLKCLLIVLGLFVAVLPETSVMDSNLGAVPG